MNTLDPVKMNLKTGLREKRRMFFKSRRNIPNKSHNHPFWVHFISIQFSSFQSVNHVRLFVTPWIAACQASLSHTISQNVPKFMSIESGMPSNHLIISHPLLLLPSIFPSIRVFSRELAFNIRWPKYWGFSFSISHSSESISIQGWFSLRLIGLISLQSKGLSSIFSNITVQKHQFFGSQLSL